MVRAVFGFVVAVLSGHDVFACKACFTPGIFSSFPSFLVIPLLFPGRNIFHFSRVVYGYPCIHSAVF